MIQPSPMVDPRGMEGVGGGGSHPNPPKMQNRDLLIEQSVKYSNRTVTTNYTIENPP